VSDPFETLEELVAHGAEVAGNEVTIRVGSFNYVFERQPDGGLKFVSGHPFAIPDDEDDKPFDPSEYR
jgi:hypothetical protein